MQTLIDQSGLVAESDYLSLSRTLAIKHDYLVDSVVGAKHKLHRQAVKSIKVLEQTVPLELWRQYSRQLKLGDNEMLEILLFLNSIGALEIRRTFSGYLSTTYKQLRRLSKGQLPITRARRWTADVLNTNQAVLIAMLPLIAAAFLTAILAYGANIESTLILITTHSFLVAIWFSTILHEQAHRLVISKKTKSQLLMQRGLRLGILHRRLSAKTELHSALIGPVVGAIASLSCCAILGIIYHQMFWTGLVGILVASFQLISLLPMYGDGRIVWSYLKGEV